MHIKILLIAAIWLPTIVHGQGTETSTTTVAPEATTNSIDDDSIDHPKLGDPDETDDFEAIRPADDKVYATYDCPASRAFRHNGYLYQFFDCPMNWAEADETCVTGMRTGDGRSVIGGHLVSILDKNESDWLEYQLNQRYGHLKLGIWIGMRRTKKQRVSCTNPNSWIDRNKVAYNMFDTSQPYCQWKDEHCFHLIDNKRWNDAECGTYMRFVCKVRDQTYAGREPTASESGAALTTAAAKEATLTAIDEAKSTGTATAAVVKEEATTIGITTIITGTRSVPLAASSTILATTVAQTTKQILPAESTTIAAASQPSTEAQTTTMSTTKSIAETLSTPPATSTITSPGSTTVISGGTSAAGTTAEPEPPTPQVIMASEENGDRK